MEYQHTAYREIVGERCAFCVTAWVDGARDEAGVRLTDLARRRLIAGLLARPHLILSGPAGAGKQRLAEALALSIAARRSSRVCLLQGHPWWAENTCDTSHYQPADAIQCLAPGPLYAIHPGRENSCIPGSAPSEFKCSIWARQRGLRRVCGAYEPGRN